MGQRAGHEYGTGRPRLRDGTDRVDAEHLDCDGGPEYGTEVGGWGL